MIPRAKEIQKALEQINTAITELKDPKNPLSNEFENISEGCKTNILHIKKLTEEFDQLSEDTEGEINKKIDIINKLKVLSTNFEKIYFSKHSEIEKELADLITSGNESYTGNYQRINKSFNLTRSLIKPLYSDFGDKEVQILTEKAYQIKRNEQIKKELEAKLTGELGNQISKKILQSGLESKQDALLDNLSMASLIKYEEKAKNLEQSFKNQFTDQFKTIILEDSKYAYALKSNVIRRDSDVKLDSSELTQSQCEHQVRENKDKILEKKQNLYKELDEAWGIFFAEALSLHEKNPDKNQRALLVGADINNALRTISKSPLDEDRKVIVTKIITQIGYDTLSKDKEIKAQPKKTAPQATSPKEFKKFKSGTRPIHHAINDHFKIVSAPDFKTITPTQSQLNSLMNHIALLAQRRNKNKKVQILFNMYQQVKEGKFDELDKSIEANRKLLTHHHFTHRFDANKVERDKSEDVAVNEILNDLNRFVKSKLEKNKHPGKD